MLATAYSLRSQLFLEQKDYLKASRAALAAKKYLDEASRISPNDPDVLYGVGLISYGMSELPAYARAILSVLDIPGDREEGLSDIEKAASDGIYTRASARMALLVIFANIEHDYRGAIACGKELIESYPNNPEIYFPYAYALSEAGDFEGALAVAAALKRKMDARAPYFDGAIVPPLSSPHGQDPHGQGTA